jgi:hypothetical protein
MFEFLLSLACNAAARACHAAWRSPAFRRWCHFLFLYLSPSYPHRTYVTTGYYYLPVSARLAHNRLSSCETSAPNRRDWLCSSLAITRKARTNTSGISRHYWMYAITRQQMGSHGMHIDRLTISSVHCSPPHRLGIPRQP